MLAFFVLYLHASNAFLLCMCVYVKSGQDYCLLNLSATVITRYTLLSLVITFSHFFPLGGKLTYPHNTHTCTPATNESAANV